MSIKITWRNGWAHLTGTHGGRRIRESLGTRSAEEADRKRAEIESRINRAEIYGEESVATFAEACELYLGQGGEATYLEPILKEFGRRRLSTIKSGEIRDLAKRLKPDCKASTLNRQVIVPARAVINFAAERGLCNHIRVKMFKEAKVLKRAIDQTWIDRFMQHAPHRHLGLLAEFMFVTGARVSEAVALTPADLDLGGGKATLGRTKNGNPRVYYLTQELVAELRTLPPKKVKDGTWRVFGYLVPLSLWRAWKATCERAGITYVSRHEAGRHSFATTMMVRNKVDIKTTAELGGWEDTKSLMKYLHPENLDKVAEGVFGRSPDTKLTRANNLKVARRKKA
jgi:integrase